MRKSLQQLSLLCLDRRGVGAEHCSHAMLWPVRVLPSLQAGKATLTSEQERSHSCKHSRSQRSCHTAHMPARAAAGAAVLRQAKQEPGRQHPVPEQARRCLQSPRRGSAGLGVLAACLS